MNISNSTKFGVVYTSPNSLVAGTTLNEGKLYFAIGDASAGITPGMYLYDGTNSELLLYGTGYIADGNVAGLLSPNMYKHINTLENYIHPDKNAITFNNAIDTSLNTGENNLSYGDSFTTVIGGNVDASGHIGSLVTKSFKLPASYVHGSYISGTTPVDPSATGTAVIPSSTSDKFTYISKVYRDASGHISKVDTSSFSLPSAAFSANTDELWKTSTSDNKVYLTGKSATDNTATAGFVNSSVYMQSGALYASNMYIGAQEVATKDYVSAQTGSVFNFQGNITSLTDISNPKSGYSYRNASTGDLTLAAANSISGVVETLEPGDIIVCTDSATPKYMVVQNNVTNNVTFTDAEPTNGYFTIFDGNTGAIKTSAWDDDRLTKAIESKADKSHSHLYTDLSTGGSTANQILVSKTDGKFELKSIDSISVGTAANAENATNAVNASTANKVANKFDISVSGSKVLEFDGSAAKSIAFKGDGSTSVTYANGVITIGSTNTQYTHPVLDKAKTTTAVDTSALSAVSSGTFTYVEKVYRDSSGHIGKVDTRSVTLPTIPTSLKNPNALTIKANDTTVVTYDGAAAKTLTIKGTGATVSGDANGNVTIEVEDQGIYWEVLS